MPAPTTPHEPALQSAATDAVIDAVTLHQQETLQRIEKAGLAVVAGLTCVRREIADFVTERIHQDVEAQRQFLRCRSLDEMRDAQASFVRTAVEQYAAEASRLVKIGNEMITTTISREEH